MTDERYSFIEDVKTRKNIARSASHKVSGAKSKKCNFPSDYLTRKEKEALNGECQSWNYNYFYTLEEFKSMPLHIQVEYIDFLVDKWNVSINSISPILFDKTPSYLFEYGKRHGIQFHRSSISGHGAKKNNIIFAEAVKAFREPIIDIPIEPEETSITEPIVDEPQKEEEPSIMERAEFVFVNGLNYGLLQGVYDMFNGHCKITITVEGTK